MEGFGVLELLKSLLEKPPQAEEKHGAGTAEKEGVKAVLGMELLAEEATDCRAD